MKLYKILPLLDFYDKPVFTIQNTKDRVLYQAEYELDMSHIYKYFGGCKVHGIRYFAETKAVIIIVKGKK